MAKIKNLHIHSENEDRLRELAAEYKYVGFSVKLAPGRLTVFSVPPPKKRECKNCEAEKPVKEFPRRAKVGGPPKFCKKCVMKMKEKKEFVN